MAERVPFDTRKLLQRQLVPGRVEAGGDRSRLQFHNTSSKTRCVVHFERSAAPSLKVKPGCFCEGLAQVIGVGDFQP